MKIVRCVSCEGYGWITDEFTGETEDCDWCQGTGYVYRDTNGIDHPIPPSDYGKVADQLERLESERMRDLGYTGTAKHPKDQAIRQGDD
ncbi:MAG: hypothetical protein MUF87_06900 [Anaerolineae bacterium]|jgi:hypothetical protein|nr:hypothetical protein [Anaerolineae bacterium]